MKIRRGAHRCLLWVRNVLVQRSAPLVDRPNHYRLSVDSIPSRLRALCVIRSGFHHRLANDTDVNVAHIVDP